MIEYNNDKTFIRITFVKLKTLSSLNKFISCVPRGVVIINYIEIYNKLLKKEDNYTDPSEAVITTYIMKQLNDYTSDDNVTHICYILDMQDDNELFTRIENISEFIQSLTEKDIQYELISDEDYSTDEAKKLNINIKKYEILQC